MDDGLKTEYDNESAKEEADKKKEQLDEAWKKKLAEREAAAIARQAAKEEEKDPTEDVDLFLKRFKELAGKVEEGIEQATEVSKQVDGISRTELAERMNDCTKIVVEMQKELANATLFLPPYDVRLSSERIVKLSADIEKARTTLAPRKKFSFKGKKTSKTDKPEVENPKSIPVAADQPPPRAAEALLAQMKLDEDEVVISGETEKVLNIVLDRPEQDVRLSNIEGCIIYIKNQSGAVRYLGLKNCKIYCGPVAGSCFFENCHNCAFHIASRQIRIHDSSHCDFYLHVLSRPIIEHCSELRFAPYNLTYSGLQEQIQLAGLDVPRAADMWKDVDDFRWLRQQHSPNWSVLPELERELADADQATVSPAQVNEKK